MACCSTDAVRYEKVPCLSRYFRGTISNPDRGILGGQTLPTMRSLSLRLLLPFALAATLSAQDAPQNRETQQSVPAATPGPGQTANAPPDATPPSGTTAPQAPDVSPTPGAEPIQQPGPDVGSVPNPTPEANGPGILSRGFTVTPLENQNLRFRPFFTLSGIADSGLTSLSSSTGQITSNQSYGIQAGFGISGRRIYRKDVIELEFRGDVYHYTPADQYDGGNYVLNLTYQHTFNRHFSVALTESAGLYSNNYSLINSLADLSVGNTQTVVTPNTQLFDNRTLSLSSGVDVVYQKSARWSFDFGGTGFLVRRESSSLYGTVGSQARADTSYRFTKRVSAGGYYAYSNYSFNKAFGGSNVQTGGGIFSYSLSRTLELRLRGGVSHVTTNGIETIAIDPVIAAILGYSTGRVVVLRSNVVPDASAQVYKTFKRATASVEFVESVTPGNGLYLTSRHAGFSGHYDYTGLRKWTLSVGAGRDTLSTLGVLVGAYTSDTARLGVSRMLTHGFQANAYGEFRRYNVSEANFLRNAYRLNIGFAWTPSDLPLKLW